MEVQPRQQDGGAAARGGLYARDLLANRLRPEPPPLVRGASSLDAQPSRGTRMRVDRSAALATRAQRDFLF